MGPEPETVWRLGSTWRGSFSCPGKIRDADIDTHRGNP
jgi:hypothetical protein